MSNQATLKKAKRKVVSRLILFFFFLIAYYIGILFLFDYAAVSIPTIFESYFLMEVMGESLLTLLVFFYVSGGRSGSRTLLNLLVVVQGIICLVPIYLFFLQPDFLLFEFSWFIALIVKAFGFYFLTGWMNTDPWARFYFKNAKNAKFFQESQPVKNPVQSQSVRQKQVQPVQTVQSQAVSQSPKTELSQAQLQQMLNQAAQSAVSQQAKLDQANQQKAEPVKKVKEKKPKEKQMRKTKPLKALNYPILAVRLGIVIYGELIVFPILIQLFSDFFISLDGRYLFASRWIFNDCLVSALLWTWSIFFLYLNMKQAKTILGITSLLQVIATAYFMFNLYTIYTGLTEYPWQVYIYLIILDVIRLAVIFWSFLPIYRLKVPETKREIDF